MALSDVQLVALRAELDTDPAGMGYLPTMPSGQISHMLNLVDRPGVKATMSSVEVQLVVASAGEFAGLNSTKKNQLISFLASETIDSSVGGYGQLVITEVFTAGATTAALAAARATLVSRADELSLPHVTNADVVAARAL